MPQDDFSNRRQIACGLQGCGQVFADGSEQGFSDVSRSLRAAVVDLVQPARNAYVDATERALTSYLGSRRLEEAKRLLGSRRPSASGVPVAGIGAVQ
jgi:hypothetical protein